MWIGIDGCCEKEEFMPCLVQGLPWVRRRNGDLAPFVTWTSAFDAAYLLNIHPEGAAKFTWISFANK